MATVTKPIALNESFNTTEATPRNIADVLAEGIGDLIHAVSQIAPQTVYDLDDLGDVDITSPSNGQVLKYNGTSQKWENGTGGGSGDSVSWSQIQQSGTKIAEIEINGVTTDVYAPTGGGFSALLVITAGTGLTVTASKGGDTYTATEISTGTYEVSVDSAGTWTVSDGSNTATVAVSASTTYYVTLSSVPDGRTVLPTDDVSIWLACGQRSEAYTTLSQVLADSTCLSALISDNNAMDYLVRSTTWASDVCGDSSAMSYIGLNNYASNTLLANSTWLDAICNSTYFESVLNVKVPVMTSNTTPSGQTFGSTSSQGEPYLAFDDNSSTHWVYSGNNVTAGVIGYYFVNPTKILKIYFKNTQTATWGAISPTQIQLQGSNDYSTWEDIGSPLANIPADYNAHTLIIPSSIYTQTYQYFRLVCSMRLQPNNYYYVMFSTLQFYGRADI